jgi:phenylalanyl-tRNA synthetase beta chain
LFEIGSVYGQAGEPRRACLAATTAAVRASLPASGALDVSKGEQASAGEAFRAFKGDVEVLFAGFAGQLRFDREAAAYFHPGRSARALLNGVPVAQFGLIHPETAAARKLRQEVFLAEFDLEQLYGIGPRTIKFTPLGKYPAVDRDYSFVFADEVTFEQMRQAVFGTGIAELREVEPVETFRGGSIAKGKYSMLLRVRLQSSERTLREDELTQWSAKIVAALSGLGGTQRA